MSQNTFFVLNLPFEAMPSEDASVTKVKTRWARIDTRGSSRT
jgi:hypothetical protein